MLPAPTTADLAAFTGRDVTSYTSYADQALAQATLLLSVLTKLDQYPDDPGQRQLAYNAILELADKIYVQQRYREVNASPFQSETIGSYSYAKILQSSQRGQSIPGLNWWEIAVEELSQVARSLVVSGSVSVFDRDHITEDAATGQRAVYGPADFLLPDLPFDVNAEKSPRDPPR